MTFTLLTSTLLAAAGDSVFGEITSPTALAPYGTSGQLVKFGNNIIILAVIVGGIYTLLNVIQAGYIYLSASGDTKAHEKVLAKITQSLWGMAIMVMAPALMAVVGFLFFKDSTFFLSPKISGPSSESSQSCMELCLKNLPPSLCNQMCSQEQAP